MPPELAEARIALCASASQLDDVLDAIDGVAAIVDSNVLLELLAADGVVAVELVPLVEESAGEVDEPVENELEIGNPLKIGETDMATA